MMKNNKLMTSSICAALLLLAFSYTIQAKPGDLDPTFGNGGVVTTRIPNGQGGFFSAYGIGSTLQKDGKIIVVGEVNYPGSGSDIYEPFVARYNTDGTLDSSFGNGGIVYTQFPAPGQDPTKLTNGVFIAVAVQPDGKIIAAGYSATNYCCSFYYSDPVLARYNTDGSLDANFGSGGKVFTLTGLGKGGFGDYASTGNGRINSLAVAPDGTFYAVGSVDFGYGQDANGTGIIYRQALVIRYSSNGGVLGSHFYNVGANEDNGHANERRKSGSAAALQADGKLVFSITGDGGYGDPRYVSDFVLMRINPDLTPDATFGTNGQVRTNFGTSLAQAFGIVIDPNGKITVSGGDRNGNNYSGNLYAACYNPNGSLDLTFGNGGKVLLLPPDAPVPSGNGSYKEGGAIVRQPDGKYVVALLSTIGALRLLPSGSVDPTFGTGGIATYDGSDPARPQILGSGGGILLQPDGKIVLPATLSNPFVSGFGVVIARLTNEPVSGNAIDIPDFYVRQQYADFLNRTPDSSGLSFWTNQINSCNGDAQCIDIKRQNVSAAFFLSREFQETGFFVIKMQRVAFGKVSNDATKRITFQQFLTDSAAVGKGFIDLQPGADQVLEQNKTNYAQTVAGSAAFVSKYPSTLSASAFVDALFATAGVASQGTERQDAINAFGAGDTTGRAAALRKVAEANSIKTAEFNQAFVLLQYFGYLRRNPTDLPDTNDSGYQFWLNKLNQFNGDYIKSEMVRSFILSSEYRKRFGTQ